MNLTNTVTFLKSSCLRPNAGKVDHFKELPRPFASIGYVFDGKWEYREYRHCELFNTGYVKKGDLLFVPMGSTYDGFWLQNETYVFSLHFELMHIGIFGSNRSAVQCICSENMKNASRDPTFDVKKEFESIAEILLRTGDDPHGKDRFEVMWRFYRILESAYSTVVSRDVFDTDVELEPAFEYIRKNYNSPCTVSYLAKLCNFSDSYFYARFKRATGVTPIEFKNRIIISKAQQLLVDCPNMTIEELSGELGFSSSAYFRRVFKEMAHMSPREFRKNEKNIL